MPIRTVEPHFSSILFSLTHLIEFSLTRDNDITVILADNTYLLSIVSSVLTKILLTFPALFHVPYLLFLGQERAK